MTPRAAINSRFRVNGKIRTSRSSLVSLFSLLEYYDVVIMAAVSQQNRRATFISSFFSSLARSAGREDTIKICTVVVPLYSSQRRKEARGSECRINCLYQWRCVGKSQERGCIRYSRSGGMQRTSLRSLSCPLLDLRLPRLQPLRSGVEKPRLRVDRERLSAFIVRTSTQ